VSEKPWSVEVKRRADRDVGRLDRQVRDRVIAAIDKLLADPENATGVRKFTGRPESRLRVGDWRVIFETDLESRTVIIDRVLPRGRAYDR
jgi:mRNA-degrading endonuclease RelE of RelBE toxin-antitoxin system